LNARGYEQVPGKHYDANSIAKGQMTARFGCEEIGEVDKYVCCKVEQNYEENSIKLTQPVMLVMLQSFVDKFDLRNGPAPNTPATPGGALVKADATDCIPADELFKYRSGVGKLLHMMRWS
jgi:hypothetical protein